MGAYFKMGRAGLESDYVPRAGEVCMHEQPPPLPDRVVVGDGKTAAKDLPSLQPLDIYARVQRLEEDVQRLRNGAASGCGAVQSATTHDAAPAAKATQPRDCSGVLSGTGDTPLDIEELLGELHHIAGSGDHVEYDIRRTACDAEHAIDRLRAWVNELQLSKIEVDAIQHVVEDGRLVDMSDYGRLRSLLVRLRPEWEDEWEDEQDESDRPEPIENGPDPDSRVWETPAKTNPTPPRNGTPAEGSVHGEGSVPDSIKWNEPVAWAVVSDSREEIDCEFVYPDRVTAGDVALDINGGVVPLYRSPSLTDAEREAALLLIYCGKQSGDPVDKQAAATLRGFLKRTGGEQ